MSKLWEDIHSELAAARLGKADPESWHDYMRLAGHKIPGATVVRLADLTDTDWLTEYPSVPIPVDLRWAIWERDDFRCCKCGSRRHLQIDHVYPKSRGGPTTAENLQTLCRSCNVRKHTKVLRGKVA